MRRVIGIDIHRTFGEVVIWEEGRLRPEGRIDMTRTALEGFGRSLRSTTGNWAPDDDHGHQSDRRGRADGGDRRHRQVQEPAEAGELFRPCPARTPVGSRRRPPWPDQQGRTQPCPGYARRGREAAAKAPGPLHAFFVQIRAKRGHQIAAVAVARKLTVPCWQLLTKGRDYHWARPALVAQQNRALELQAGQPMKKGNKRGPAYAYNVKDLREQEMRLAEQAERELRARRQPMTSRRSVRFR